MKPFILVMCSLALAIPLSAKDGAGEPKKAKKPNPQAVFKKKDKDSDGFLSKEEFIAKAKDAAKAETAFTKKDKNSDSKLSPEEFAGKPAGKGGKGGKGGKKKAN